jgi:hypothetical protein
LIKLGKVKQTKIEINATSITIGATEILIVFGLTFGYRDMGLRTKA